MTSQEWNEGLNQLDSDLIQDYILQKDEVVQRKKAKHFWLRLGAAAACLALIVGVILLFPTSQQPDLPPQITAPIPSTPIIFGTDNSLSGSNLEFVVGSTTQLSGESLGEDSPPQFEFEITDFIVKARVVANYPDTYYRLNVRPDYKPTAYRLIQMEVLDAIQGQNLPQYFLYLLPESLYVDMSQYDTLLISMIQTGTENHVLKNGTQNRMEALSLPVFIDNSGQPELGNIIAFRDGVFDEGLWQTESWIYGYQFARYYLENPKHGNLVVKRGGTEEDAIAEINRRIEARKQQMGEAYKEPSPVTLSFTAQAAKDAIAFVRPFENGVFCQMYSSYDNRLIYRRYINGCETEETITIDLATEEVTYSQVCYTAEDVAKLENIALHLADKAAEYAQTTPTPPHTNPEGKKLLCLNLYAWYAKVDGRLYGVIKTAWRYSESEDWYIQYYDDSYTLYDMTEGTAQVISRDDLVALIGTRNVYIGQYHQVIYLPQI